VATGQCDFAVISVPPQDLSSMRWDPLFRDPMAPVAAATHSLVRMKSVDWDTLAAQMWVVPGVGTPVRTWFERQFTLRRIPVPEHLISMRDYFATPEFGAALGAVSLMPASFTRVHPEARKYRELRTPPDWVSDRVVGILRRRAGYISPAADRLVQSIIEVGGKLGLPAPVAGR
jgi:DNA-binding transcriptional LysR family regulator